MCPGNHQSLAQGKGQCGPLSLLPGPSEELPSNLHKHLGANFKSSVSSCQGDFPGGPGIENLAANMGDTGSLPGPGGFHTTGNNSPAPQLLKPEGSRDPTPWEASPDLLQLGKACPPQDPQQPKDMFRLFLQAKQGKQNTNQAISIQREAGPGSQKLNGELERGT